MKTVSENIQVFSSSVLDHLTQKAKNNHRLRQHRNIHQSHQEPCQRLLNAIEPDSYIRPHRHLADPKDELLIALRGKMALLAFDDYGVVQEVLFFGTDKHGMKIAVGA